MSFYDWPPGAEAPPRVEPADAAATRASRFTFDADAARRSTGRPAPSSAGAARAPASGRTHLWQPLGPDTVLHGDVVGASRITGRVTMLAVHPDGQRVYAASANGGVWYSGDGGAQWHALDGLGATPGPAAIDRPAHRHACGAIAVNFGSGTGTDTVFVGTGEPWHAEGVAAARRTDGQPGQPFGGVGILVGTHDPTSGSTTWLREAANLVGSGVYRLALQPGGSRIVAATTAGLFERPASQAETAWTRMAGDPFATLEVDCSDVLWTAGAGATPPRLWVWVSRGAQAGLWMSPTDAAAAWQRLETPGATARRAVLAAATPQEVWLFCDHPDTSTRPGGAAGGARTPRSAPADAVMRFRDDCGCWFRSSDDVRQGFVQRIETQELVPVTYSVIKGRAIFEGDIDLGPETEMEQLRAALRPGAPKGALRGIAIRGQAFRWPGGIVPWESTAALRPLAERAIAHWESRTRIRFVERVAGNAAFYPNWISFEAVDGCSSPVGMRGGKQVVSLADGCGFGAAVHEVGHALGLWHEQSRADRDAHVRIVTANIKPGKEHNFDQHVTDGDDIGAYDYASIMHYPRDAFSSNGQDTIVPIGGQTIGQREGLSAGDVSAIGGLYPDLVRPLLFRIAAGAVPLARPVIDLPDVLGRSGHYAIAMAVHPTQTRRLVLGGARHAATAPGVGALRGSGGLDDAALLAADVDVDGRGMLVFGQPSAPAMIGVGVHAHVHHIVYSNGGNRLWVACDGGVYRSDLPDSPVGFAAMNTGLSVVEANYVAGHPQCEGHVVAGAQNHGMLGRHAGAVWLREGDGEGGGVAFDPTRPARYLYQADRGRWRSSDGSFAPPPLAPGEDNAERSAARAMPALVTKLRPGAPAGQQTLTQTIVGTSRLWYTEDFGLHWVTLPGGTAPPAGNLAHDDFGQPITVCRWQGSEVAWVLGEGRLRRYARTAGSDSATGPGTWTAETIVERGVKPKKDTTKANGPIREAAVWTDIAVNLEPPAADGQPPVARGTRGALYLGTVGKPGSEEVDTLWWFDGSERWFATGLRRSATPAPVTAVVCDPAFPDEVYVGTSIGVWMGVRNLADPSAPTWSWSARLNGLPEAAVADLAIHHHDGLRLLRAAIASRGVWELRLDQADVADLAYLRAHDDDLRHRATASLSGRDGTTPRAWHASPDLRPRRAPLAAPMPATLPWTLGSPLIDAELLRRFQSALRARTGDPRVRPTGRWDTGFNEVLRSLNAPTVAPGTVRLDEAFWTQSMQMPWAVAEPWGSARPSSADLLEFSEAMPAALAGAASCELPPDAGKVDVLVQYRGLAPLDGAEVRVALLKWLDPQSPPTARHDDASTWPAGDVPWTAAINQVLNSATGNTSLPLGSGWSLVGSRQTLAGQKLDALRPGIATFDLDLAGLADDRLVLLVAVIRAGGDVALAPATLQALVLGHANVAARSLRIHGTSVAAPAVRNPFPTVPYALQMAPSAAQNARLASALSTVRATLDAGNQDRLDKAALIVLRLTPSGTMDYAGVRETEMFFSASLLKVVLLYASFELAAQVNALAPSLTATSAPKFLDRVRREFAATIERSVRRIRPGAWRKVSFGEALTASPAGANQFRVQLSAAHLNDLRSIFVDQRNNDPPSRCMHRLGYSYVNRALEAAGFLDSVTGTGLWMATDYGGWSDFHVPVSTRSTGRVPRNGSSSAAMTALAMASLLAHMHRGQLVDTASSQAMRGIVRPGGTWLSGLPSRDDFSFTGDGAKVGHSPSASAFVGSVMSEAAFLKRKSDDAPFLAVWQNVPDALGSEPIYRVIDEMIRTWP
jgi:hypothetical protein